MDIDLLFILLIAGLVFVIALVCANVGSGGGPSYLAVLAIAGYPYAAIRLASLLLCATLSLVMAFRYYRVASFSWRILLPLVVGSIPAAYLANSIVLSPFAYKSLAGGVFLCSALGWIIPRRKSQRGKTKLFPIWLGLVSGAAIGLLSGLVGIGGSTFLLPILIFGGWTASQDLRATVSAFVFLTSIAALAGDHPLEVVSFPQMLYWVPAVLFAAWLGTEFQLGKSTAGHLTRFLSLILVLGALKLFLTYSP